jgi:pimeloyl-ACP methyl ester carboxylesterase
MDLYTIFMHGGQDFKGKMKMNLLLQLFLYGAIFYVLCMIFMYLRQDSLLFYPNLARHEGHGDERVVDYSLRRGAVTLRGWLVNPGLAQEKLLMYYGGNAEDVFLNVDEFKDIHAATLFVAYRGYGPSGGRPGEAEIFADALAVIDDMRSRYSPEQVFLIGRSLGSGVACYVASRREVQGAILVTPYDSIENVAKSHYPWLPVALFLRHRFASLEYARDIRCPLLVVYGGEDKVIGPARTENLIRHIRGQKEIVFLASADHGTIDMHPAYWQAILRFINPENVVAAEQQPGESVQKN